MSTGKVVEMWFEYGSTYSYLSAMRVEKLVAAKGLALEWKPFMLGPIFKELGWQGSPFLEQKEKLAYMWKDLAHQTRKYGLPWKQPTVFPRSAVLALRVTLLGESEPWVGAFVKAMMLKNFAEDQEISSEAVVEGVLLGLGLDAEDILQRAVSEENKTALRNQTQRARDLGIFGGPTFMVQGEMFWGNDRLEDALEYAVSRQA